MAAMVDPLAKAMTLHFRIDQLGPFFPKPLDSIGLVIAALLVLGMGDGMRDAVQLAGLVSELPVLANLVGC